MAESSDTAARLRGRPRGGARSHVHDDLLNALRACLDDKLHSEITLKEVAERAGTSQEMVRYYFGSKDGLVSALVRQTSDRFADRLGELERDILALGGNPTRHLIATLNELYLSERKVARIPASEFQKAKSVLRDELLNERAELVISHIHRIVQRLMTEGIYDQALDARAMATSIMTMVSGPVVLLAILPATWVSAEELGSDGWVDHLTELVDRRCRRA
jgi:AcrR family transcriptional regulator